MLLFSDMGGIDIEEVAEKHPEHLSRTHFSSILPLSERVAKEAISAVGVTGDDLNALTPIVFKLLQLFLEFDLTLAEINPLAKLDERQVHRARRPRRHGGRGARRAQSSARASSGIGDDETRLARPPTAFELAGARVNAADHRGVAGNVVEFDGNLGLIIGAGGGSLTLFDAVRKHGGKPANYCEIGGNPSVGKVEEPDEADSRQARRREDRGDDERGLEHARRHRRARRDQGLSSKSGNEPGRRDRDLPHSRLVGGGRLQDPREVRRRVLRPQRLDVRGRGPRRRKAEEELTMSILITKDTTFIIQGITGREAVSLTRENLDYGTKIVGGVTPGRAGRDVYGVPVYDTVREIVQKHGQSTARSSRCRRASRATRCSRRSRTASSARGLVTENIPRSEVAQMVELATLRGARIIGPNCLGMLSPGEAKMGGLGGPAANTRQAFTKGPIGVMSR